MLESVCQQWRHTQSMLLTLAAVQRSKAINMSFACQIASQLTCPAWAAACSIEWKAVCCCMDGTAAGVGEAEGLHSSGLLMLWKFCSCCMMSEALALGRSSERLLLLGPSLKIGLRSCRPCSAASGCCPAPVCSSCRQKAKAITVSKESAPTLTHHTSI